MRRKAQNGELIPLRLVSGTLTGDNQRIDLLYAESLSEVVFLQTQWGDAGMAKLLAAYKAGLQTDAALREATGLNFEQFQQSWWEWLGGKPGMYPTPPPTPGTRSAIVISTATARPPAVEPSATPAPVLATPSSPVKAARPGFPCAGAGVLG